MCAAGHYGERLRVADASDDDDGLRGSFERSL